MNALGHMAAGLTGNYSNLSEMRVDSYIDQNGNDHKSISDNPPFVNNLEVTNLKFSRTLE